MASKDDNARYLFQKHGTKRRLELQFSSLHFLSRLIFNAWYCVLLLFHMEKILFLNFIDYGYRQRLNQGENSQITGSWNISTVL